MAVAPFGIEIGAQPVCDFDEVTPYIKVTSTPPSPHPQFKSYMFVSAPATGVARVLARTLPNDNDDFGSATRAIYERLLGQLTGRYGAAQTFDFLKVGSIWTEDREFASSIRADERVLSAFWETGQAKLPAELEEIQLRVVDEGEGLIVLVTYTGSNWPALESEMLESEASVL